MACFAKPVNQCGHWDIVIIKGGGTNHLKSTMAKAVGDCCLLDFVPGLVDGMHSLHHTDLCDLVIVYGVDHLF